MATNTTYRVVSGDEVIAERVAGAFSFLARLRGLLGRQALANGFGLWLRPGGSVHTLGMSFPIDVLFLDDRQTILHTQSCVTPGRFCLAPRQTRSTLELWSGAVEQQGLASGVRLSFEWIAR